MKEKEFIVKASDPYTIETFEANEAPEIVRCKDCKYFQEDVQDGTCYHHDLLYPYRDWFCADGVKE